MQIKEFRMLTDMANSKGTATIFQKRLGILIQINLKQDFAVDILPDFSGT
jgi:hypothetical protein